jgi:hypothetical protein
MSGEDRRPAEAPEEERTRQALRSLPPPAADPSFRERLKAEFSSGAIAERDERFPASAGTESARGAMAGIPWWRGFFSLPRLWIPVAAAAAASLALVVGLMNQGPAWTVADVRGTGVARIDGAPVDLSSTKALERRIKPGATLQVPEGAEINLMAGRTLAMLVTSGTDMTVPAAPARWFDRRSDVRIRHGILRFATGPRFHGARLTVHTPEAEAEVVGTVFAVICEPGVETCVCVYQGTVRVGRHTGEDMVMVPAGMRRTVFAGERPPEVGEMRIDERGYLTRYHEEMDSIMK